MKWTSRFILALFFTSFSNPSFADSLTYLPHQEIAIAKYIKTIRSSRRSIDMAYYIYDPCSIIGRLLLRELEKQKQRHAMLQVRLLIDAKPHGRKGRAQIIDAFQRRGFNVRFFNYSNGKNMSNRMHLKMLLADQEEYIIGGRNIDDSYYGMGEFGNWIDREVHVRGKTAEEAALRFDELWKHWHTKDPSPEKIGQEDKNQIEEKCLKPEPKLLELEKYFDENLDKILEKENSVRCENTELQVDSPEYLDRQWKILSPNLSGDIGKLKRASVSYVEALKSANSKIDIENYSYIPTGEVNRVLKKIAARGNVDIKIYVNDAVDEHQRLMVPVALSYQRPSQQGNTKIIPLPRSDLFAEKWKFSSESQAYSLHAKTLVVDEKTSIVGTFNIDPRSYHSNLEGNLVAKDCKDFAMQVKGAAKDSFEQIEKLLENSDFTNCIKRSQAPIPSGLDVVLSWLAFDLL